MKLIRILISLLFLTSTKLALSYRNLGVSLAAINAVSPEDRIKFGTTKSSDFQFRLFGKRTYEFFYQTYTGYYLKNSTELDSSYASSASKLLRSDISTRNFGLNFYWEIMKIRKPVESKVQR